MGSSCKSLESPRCNTSSRLTKGVQKLADLSATLQQERNSLGESYQQLFDLKGMISNKYILQAHGGGRGKGTLLHICTKVKKVRF